MDRGTALFAYVGSRTTRERNARGEGISVFRVQAETGALELVQLVGDLVNPSYLAFNRKRDRLYTVHGDGHEISVFEVDRQHGRLSFLQRQACGGKNPVHLAVDPSDRYLVVSDHLGSQGGTLAVMGINKDGSLAPVHQRVALAGKPGPHRVEQPFSKPHFNPFDPSGRFVVVPDKGLDKVFVFAFKDGELHPTQTPWMQCREGAGPRHIAFHPQRSFAYVVNELDSTVVACRFDMDAGSLHAMQVLPALPDDFTGHSRAAEIEVSRDGRHVYVSNRGADNIAAFDVDQKSGRLRWLGAFETGGKTPRFFAISPSGRRLYALNEDSDTITMFALDGSELAHALPHQATHCASPVCMVFLE